MDQSDLIEDQIIPFDKVYPVLSGVRTNKMFNFVFREIV